MEVVHKKIKNTLNHWWIRVVDEQCQQHLRVSRSQYSMNYFGLYPDHVFSYSPFSPFLRRTKKGSSATACVLRGLSVPRKGDSQAVNIICLKSLKSYQRLFINLTWQLDSGLIRKLYWLKLNKIVVFGSRLQVFHDHGTFKRFVLGFTTPRLRTFRRYLYERMASNVQTVRAIVFDIRRARANDSKFMSSAEVFILSRVILVYRFVWKCLDYSFRLCMKYHFLPMQVHQAILLILLWYWLGSRAMSCYWIYSH